MKLVQKTCQKETVQIIDRGGCYSQVVLKSCWRVIIWGEFLILPLSILKQLHILDLSDTEVLQQLVAKKLRVHQLEDILAPVCSSAFFNQCQASHISGCLMEHVFWVPPPPRDSLFLP